MGFHCTFVLWTQHLYFGLCTLGKAKDWTHVIDVIEITDSLTWNRLNCFKMNESNEMSLFWLKLDLEWNGIGIRINEIVLNTKVIVIKKLWSKHKIS